MQRLEETVAVPLRAGVTIPSLAQCVEELVLNSIDAHASSLTIRVGVEKGFIEISDDGDGILATSFECLGEPCHSSKCTLPVAATYGFRGEALVAIRMLSESLEIRSRHTTSGFTFVKIFNRGVTLPVRRTTEFSSRGTTVIVRNLFYNLPVRQASLLCASNMSHVCHAVKAVLLIYPRVSVALKNDCGDVLVSSARAASSVELFASFFDHDKARKLRAICHLCGVYKLSGWICREGHTNRSLQFVYVNHKLVQDQGINELLEQLFQNSIITQKSNGRESMSGQSLHVVYVLNLLCPTDQCIFVVELEKRLVEFMDYACVLCTFRGLVHKFLARESLYRHIAIPTTMVQWKSKQQAIIARAGRSTEVFPLRPEVEETITACTSLVMSEKVKRQRQKYIGLLTVDSTSSIEECIASQMHSFSDGQQVAASQHNESNTDASGTALSTRHLVEGTAIQQYCFGEEQQAAVNQCEQLGMDVIGTAAKRPSTGFNSLIGSAVNEMVTKQTGTFQASTSLLVIWEAMRLSSLTLCSIATKPFRFSKDMLTNAKVIGQVNSEFIACVVTSEKSKSLHPLRRLSVMDCLIFDDSKFVVMLETRATKSGELSLVLIDQHAAHERVRLEELEDGLIVEGVLSSRSIQPPIIISLLDLSCQLSSRGIHSKLERWGIVGTVLTTNGGRLEMSIVKAPTVLMKNDSSELLSVEILKNLIAELISNQQRSLPGTGWPVSLTEVLHSKACHGAIRFGDSLTKRQCIWLVKELAKCRLAFQCAHGRPTVQPLSNINELEKHD